jgi:predicted CXXCH cytochrome family protein
MQCHLETTSSPLPGSIRRYDREPFSYRPGQPLGNYAIYFDKPEENNQRDRFEIAHAAYRLRKSECFRMSQLTCTTCHNPHEALDSAQAIERYQAVCRGCHEKAHASAKQISDCTGCHMPKRRTEDAVHVVMTDHYIRKEQTSGNLLAPLQETPPESITYRGPVKLYYPTFIGNAADQDLYLALAQVQNETNLLPGVPQLARAIAGYAPNQPDFYFELGKAYYKQGEKQKAIGSLEQSLIRQPDFMKSQRELVAELLANGDTARSVTVIRDVLKRSKPDAILLTNLGNAYLHEDKITLAEEALRQALQLEPELPEANNLLGMSLVRHSDKNAERYFREAIRFQPEFPAAHNNLANLLATAGDYAQAGYHYEKAIAADPSYAEAHHAYGLLLEVTRSYDRALTEFQKAVKLDPGFALAHSDLADLLAAGGKNAASEEEYRLAIRSNPKLTEAMYGLANVLAAEGKPAEAEGHLRKALTVDPRLYEAHLLLGKLLAAKGDNAEAKSHFQRAAESPDPEVRQAAMKELR